jgi:beta-lactamase class A
MSLYDLDSFFQQFGTDIGIYFKNLDTGFVYTFNPERIFFGASLSKANQALYVYMAAERGYIDMYAVHTFQQSDFWGGTGVIRFMPAGTQFTTRELLYYSVVHSDNVAFRMLARAMNRTNFSYRHFATELGANTRFILDNYSHNTSAADTALWFYAMHQYFMMESRYAHYLQHDLLNTAQCSHPYFTRGNVFGGNYRIPVQLMHGDYPIAQKYGWGVQSFHTAGIVYAPSPFLLVILSNRHNGAHALFEEISWFMQDFNARYF